MQFLRIFLNAFKKWRIAGKVVRQAESNSAARVVPPSFAFVRPNGTVARFVFKRRDLFEDGRPKPKAFQPEFHPDLGRYEVSVCGLCGVSSERMWHLGKTVRAKQALSAIAALRLSVDSVVASGLKCEAAPELPDFPEHGVIVGWDPDPDAKSARLNAQVTLAAAIPVAAVLRPPL